MPRMYMTGYSGATRDEAGLFAWAPWARFDPEFRRRLKMLMDDAIDKGFKVGVGGGWRSSDAQRDLFLSRYHREDDNNLTGSVYWNGVWWEKNDGAAPAAPPGRSYHESTTKTGMCLAADMVGNLTYLTENCGRFGLVHFGNINGEPWHLQPIEIPHSRSGYDPAKHEPLKRWEVPTSPPAPPAPIPSTPVVPKPTIRLATPYQSGKEVMVLQRVLKFWGWYTSVVDGWAGPATIIGIKQMQRALKIKDDGVYGPVTAAAYKKFAEGMAAVQS